MPQDANEQHRLSSALVTGASKGIGEACALRLHGLGFRVFAGVRRSEDGAALRARAGTERLVPVLLDVTSSDQIRAAAVHIEEAVGSAGLDALVNNAGISIAGPIEFLPVGELRYQLDVNVVGQVAVTQALLPALRRARGRIVFIGSISGRSAVPFTGAYAASKHALEAITDALRVELASSGLQVSIVEPGVIATPIWESSVERANQLLENMPPQLEEYYGVEIAGLRRRVAGVASRAAPPDTVAAAVEHALTARRPRARYVVGRDARLRLLLERVLPTRLRDRILLNRLRKLT